MRTKYQSDVIKAAENPSYTPTYTRDEYLKWQQGTERGYQGFDWYDFATAPGAQSYFGANISGGSDKVSYYMSLSNTDQEYAIRDFGGFNRTNIQINVDANITKRFSLGAQVSGRLQTTKAPGLGGGDRGGLDALRFLPQPADCAALCQRQSALPRQDGPELHLHQFCSHDAQQKRRRYPPRTRRANQPECDYKFTDWLSLKLIGGYAYQNSSRVKQVKTFDLYDYDKATGEYYVIDGERNPSLYKSYGNTEDYTGQFTFDFHKQFDRHNVALTLGGEASHHISPGTGLHLSAADRSDDPDQYGDAAGHQ